jgi:hypothetical protein
MRKYLSFLLLGVLSLVGLGAAVLGVVQGSSGTALGQAVTNTLGSPNYTEYLVEKTPQGSQVGFLVYQAPDKGPGRLGGWIESAGRRTYVVIIGSTEYLSVTRTVGSAKAPLNFYVQQVAPVQVSDPAHRYLSFWNCQHSSPCPTTRSGSVSTVTVSQGGQSEKLTFTVTGNYVSEFRVAPTGGSITLTISDVGTSPPVALPKGAKVVSSPGQVAG